MAKTAVGFERRSAPERMLAWGYLFAAGVVLVFGNADIVLLRHISAACVGVRALWAVGLILVAAAVNRVSPTTLRALVRASTVLSTASFGVLVVITGGSVSPLFGVTSAIPLCIVVIIQDDTAAAASAAVSNLLVSIAILVHSGAPISFIVSWSLVLCATGSVGIFVSFAYRSQCRARVLAETARDSAERLRTEEALRLSEARFSRLSDSGLVGIVLADAFGNVHDANDTYLKMTGFSKDDLHAGRIHWKELTPPEWKHTDEIAGERLKATGVAPVWEKELFRKDHSRVPILIGIASLDFPNVIVCIADLTERKKAEERQRSIEARYRMLFEKSPLPKWVYDLETLDVLEVNEAATRTYGYSRNEFLKLRITDLASPGESERLLAQVQTVSKNGHEEPVQGSCETRRKDGSVFDVEINGHTLLFEGRKARLMVVKDVSERKRLQNELLQSQKLEAMGRLAGGVAHDFNNMLSVILSYSTMLRDDLKAGDPMREEINEIRKAGERASALTRQLLAFSRKQVLDPRPVNLNDIVEPMQGMLRRLIGEDIVLETRLGGDLGTVKVDTGQIEQVLLNLVVNARDAMPKGGNVTICTRNASARSKSFVVLEVSDTGTGMDEATKSRIFEPFFTTKERGKGTGLGLSTVFGIVQQSGGTVDVESKPGEGTTFRVCLPLSEEAPDDLSEAAPSSDAQRGSETILLVEDEEQVRGLAREILRRQGYRVIEARNPGEALLICESASEAVELLLTDVVMPQMSGPEVARRLVALRPKMKVLFMSGYTDDGIVHHGILDPGIAFLQKPITPDVLASRVRQVLDAHT